MSTRTKPRLGRGLSSLIREPVQVDVPEPIPEPVASPAAPKEGLDSKQNTNALGLDMVSVAELVANRFQPRREFEPTAMNQLAASIKSAGIMQPIAVRSLSLCAEKHPDATALTRWEIVAGERRWRAAQLAGLKRVPVIVSELDDQQASEWAVIENVQREDLNPIERAWAYRGLIEKFGLSQAAVGERIGVERSTVANVIRLTELEQSIQDMIARDELSMGHGKALLGMDAGTARERVAMAAHKEGWSVRRLEEHVRDGAGRQGSGTGATASSKSGRSTQRAEIADLEKQLGEHLGTKVRIKTSAGGKKGSVTIEFYDLDHFDSLMTMVGFQMNS